MRRCARTSLDSAIRMLGKRASRLQLRHSLAVSPLPLRARALTNRSLSCATRRRDETLRDADFNKGMSCASMAGAYLFVTLAVQYKLLKQSSLRLVLERSVSFVRQLGLW